MITPQELRIGNYIEITSGFGEWQVMEVKLDDIQLCIEDNEFFNERYARPIPITEYMLLSYGFKYVTNSWLQIKYATNCDEVHQISINLIGGRFSIMDDVDDTTPVFAAYTVRYLHQLQNLYFALTGNELKVKPE